MQLSQSTTTPIAGGSLPVHVANVRFWGSYIYQQHLKGVANEEVF